GLFGGLRGRQAGQGVGRGGGRREGGVAYARGRRGEGGDLSHGCSSLLAPRPAWLRAESAWTPRGGLVRGPPTAPVYERLLPLSDLKRASESKIDK
ncbi:hypothetical protein DKP78_17920, partial [Enterococcus faecium]